MLANDDRFLVALLSVATNKSWLRPSDCSPLNFIIMDHADDGGNEDDDVFVYMGGNQFVPRDVTHVRIHKSVKIICKEAFSHCRNLESVEMHDGVEIIEEEAFYWCTSLKGIKLPGVRVIGEYAFASCKALADVEFGGKLETIENSAFAYSSLRNIKLPKVGIIQKYAFSTCEQLTDVELSKDLGTIGHKAFWKCPHLRRIALPLKDNLLDDDVFLGCDDLSKVDLVGGTHKNISSLLLEIWRNEMNYEIHRINQDLPNTPAHRDKTTAIRQWMEEVTQRINHFKAEHYTLLKRNMTQLELALWDANLPNVDAAECRHEARVTCGANIIIPHVLSFLNNEEVFPTVRNVPL